MSSLYFVERSNMRQEDARSSFHTERELVDLKNRL